jgi:transposase-like protein
MNCPDCGRQMINIGGIGSPAQLICNHTNCPGKHRNVSCPSCGSLQKKSIIPTGMGGQFQYVCGSCGQTY